MATIIIVGAGMAGLTCGRRLQAAGHQVVWLEKSRGVGGRLATRRLDGGGWVDQGVRYWSPSAGLDALTQPLLDQGLLHRWQAQGFRWDGALQTRSVVAYCAERGVNAIAKHLAQSCDIRRQQRVIALAKTEDGWQLTSDGPEGISEIVADAVVLAVPAPQALPLLTSLDDGAVAALSQVNYSPCLSVIATYDRLPDQPDSGWHISAEHPVLAWLSLESSKPVTHPSVNAVLLQSQASFAAQYFERLSPDKAAEAILQQTTVAQMLAAAAEILPGLEPPQTHRLHCWRYSFVERPYPEAILQTQCPSLVCCGDWCCPDQLTNLAAAYRSGIAAAEFLA